MNEQEEFLKDLNVDPNKVDVLDQPLVPEPVKETEENKNEIGEVEGNDDESGEDGKPRNRRERRLMQRLQAERESSMFLAGKLEARTEAQKSVTEEEDYLKTVEQIYGNDTPEKQIATELLKKAIVGARDDAERRVYERVVRERQEESSAETQAEKELDSIIERIEDEHGVSLTETQERAYFQLLERMSPKDRNGTVIEYADSEAVWEVFKDRLSKKPADTRARDMSSRSMTQSGSSTQSNLQDDVAARFLKDQGII